MSHAVAALLALLAVVGCAPDEPVPSESPAPLSKRAAAPGPLPAGGDSSALDPSDPRAAVDVVLTYYGDLARRDFRAAAQAWGPSGPPDQTYDQFVAGFAEIREVRAVVDEPSAPEGAAGSVYVTVPVRVATLRTDSSVWGTTGGYTLRRVNAMPGAEPWSLRWHLVSAELHERRVPSSDAARRP